MKYFAVILIIIVLYFVIFPTIGYFPDIFTAALIGIVLGLISAVID